MSAASRPDLFALVGTVAEGTAVQTLASFATLALPAVAPTMARALHLPVALIAAQLGLNYAAAMASSLIAGSLVRRLGAVRTSQAALLLIAFGALVVSEGSLSTVVAGSLLIGIGYGLVNPATSHLLMRTTSAANRNIVFSLKQSGVPLGGMLAGMIGPPIAESWGWPWVMAVVAAGGILLTAALEPSHATWDDDRDRATRFLISPFSGLSALFGNRAVRTLALTGVCYGFGQLSLSAFCVTMLVRELGWSLVNAGLVLATVQVAGAVGRIFWGVLADWRLGGSLTLGVIGAIAAASALTIGVAGPAWPSAIVVGVLMVFGASAIGWFGVYLAEVARTSPAGRVGQATGLSQLFAFGGALAAPPVFAALHHFTASWTIPYGLVALPLVAGALLCGSLAKRQGLAADKN